MYLMARSQCSGARHARAADALVRLPARQWGERVRTGFPGGLVVQRRTKCQSRNHGIPTLYRTDEGRNKAPPRISLARVSCDVAAAPHIEREVPGHPGAGGLVRRQLHRLSGVARNNSGPLFILFIGLFIRRSTGHTHSVPAGDGCSNDAGSPGALPATPARRRAQDDRHPIVQLDNIQVRVRSDDDEASGHLAVWSAA
jgi:hypothetical protein